MQAYSSRVIGATGGMRVSKKYFGLLDIVSDDMDQTEIVAEITSLKCRINEMDRLQLAPVGKTIKAELRPYQLHGFQWMQTLDALQWGGLLADDMGLGKTLQTIVFLDFVKKKKTGLPSLVICPVSLLFNWESEIKKFAPHLKFKIYHGIDRSLEGINLKKQDLVLSSYGTVRSDVELFAEMEWEYIILDESQAIKNPDSMVAKAVGQLRSKNRLALSGTPIQNNTFDLYSQFHFLNNGLLGSRNFFKEEFSNSIDKNQDQDRSEQLRKLIHPFMLRRTKELVAKDLPTKTEIELWCDMPDEQRQVYDKFRDFYKQSLLEKIDEVGMGSAGFLILEGLLRLRQICDSPKLLKDSKYNNIAGVKVEELLRELEENLVGKKVLVFSQFTEMLDIIEKELLTRKKKFVRLDGSTPTKKRQLIVGEFQDDQSIEIFLISLKAGGVGLNLTAAEYVFLVDPWWNPAAEQQAIDRTHRIGQTKKVFAYKMLCRNSVEERILALQQKKSSMAKGLISEDTAMFKTLKKEDVAFLFS